MIPTKRRTFAVAFSLAVLCSLSCYTGAFAQPGGSVRTVPVADTLNTLVNKVTIMPYLTVSLNLFNGKAFPKPASGLGFGGGLMFDLTDDGQKYGLVFDFAYQDMRGKATDGNCVHGTSGLDSVLFPADAEHYWQYVLFEPFLKVQTGNSRGYFLLGASFGFAVLSETVSIAPQATEYALWEGSPSSNQFRFDLRAGLGVRLAEFSGHQLILEGRFGYPLTNVISNYTSACGDGTAGGWKVVTAQANVGLRL